MVSAKIPTPLADNIIAVDPLTPSPISMHPSYGHVKSPGMGWMREGDVSSKSSQVVPSIHTGASPSASDKPYNSPSPKATLSFSNNDSTVHSKNTYAVKDKTNADLEVYQFGCASKTSGSNSSLSMQPDLALRPTVRKSTSCQSLGKKSG